MDQAASHQRARRRGANPVVYWAARLPLELLLKLYFRVSKLGAERIPDHGPAIIASNHRSFMDPFVIGTMVRRPVYYVAKSELFRIPLLGWLLSALGAFPVERGAGDLEAVRTAEELLARGEIVLIFPEGTRTRPGPLGAPKRGVGRLALETGAPVIPVAIIGTDDVRRGIFLRPRRVRVAAGAPLHFPREQRSSPKLAAAVVSSVWTAVEAQWEQLGGVAADPSVEQSELASVS